MEEENSRQFDAEMWLRSLAGDILEHEGCDGCRQNAATALERLGSLEETLARHGIEDPREAQRRALAGQQAQAAAGRPPVMRLEVEVEFVIPEPKKKSVDRITKAIRKAVEKAIEKRGGVRQGMFTVVMNMDRSDQRPPD